MVGSAVESAGGGEGGTLPIRGFDRARGATAGGASSSVGILGPVRKASEVVNVLLARHVEGVATLDSIELPILSEAALNNVSIEFKSTRPIDLHLVDIARLPMAVVNSCPKTGDAEKSRYSEKCRCERRRDCGPKTGPTLKHFSLVPGCLNTVCACIKNRGTTAKNNSIVTLTWILYSKVLRDHPNSLLPARIRDGANMAYNPYGSMFPLNQYQQS